MLFLWLIGGGAAVFGIAVGIFGGPAVRQFLAEEITKAKADATKLVADAQAETAKLKADAETAIAAAKADAATLVTKAQSDAADAVAAAKADATKAKGALETFVTLLQNGTPMLDVVTQVKSS